jgi:hypothetical protein
MGGRLIESGVMHDGCHPLHPPRLQAVAFHTRVLASCPLLVQLEQPLERIQQTMRGTTFCLVAQ